MTAKEQFDLQRRWNKCKIIYGIVAICLFGMLLAATFFAHEDSTEETKVRYVMLGDSILGQFRDDTSVSFMLSELLGEPVFNGALGGTGMGRLDEEMRLANAQDCLSMQALSQAIVTEEFGSQQTVRNRESGTEYFEETINELERIDFESVEILFIEHGINDYHGAVPICNEDDPYDIYSFEGALRTTVENIQKKYPQMRIILITPTFAWYHNEDGAEVTCEEYNLGGGVLEEYVDFEIAMADELGVEVIDIYHDFYTHENWSDWEKYTIDGVHPNEVGRKMIAEKVYAYLMGN